MVQSFAAVLAFGALLAPAAAALRNFTDFPSEFRVGQLVTLHWPLNPGESVGRLTLQHEDVPGDVLQYETICQWNDASGLNGKGEGVTSIDWVPNVAGPYFHLILNDNDIYSPIFSILAADGTPVYTVPSGIDPFSNIMPQTATPIWYPNNPHKTAAAATSESPSLLTTVAVVTLPTETAAVSTSPAVVAITSSVLAVASTLSPVLPLSSSTSAVSSSLAPATTLATSGILPLANATVTPYGSGTTGLATQTPTQVFTGAAVAMKSGLGAAVMAVAGCAVGLPVSWYIGERGRWWM